jgi:hypothetical protein
VIRPCATVTRSAMRASQPARRTSRFSSRRGQARRLRTGLPGRRVRVDPGPTCGRRVLLARFAWRPGARSMRERSGLLPRTTVRPVPALAALPTEQETARFRNFAALGPLGHMGARSFAGVRTWGECTPPVEVEKRSSTPGNCAGGLALGPFVSPPTPVAPARQRATDAISSSAQAQSPTRSSHPGSRRARHLRAGRRE